MQSDEKIGLIIHGPTGIRLRYWRVTDLNAVTKKKVCALAKDIIRDKLTRWRFFYSGKCHVTNHSGKTMHFKNIGFEGTPRHVFWNGFVEPFLEDAIEQVLESTAERCRKYDLEPEPYIDEALGLLWNFLIENAYDHMVETERILRGKGCPKGPRGVIPEDVKDKMRNMHRVLEEHRKAAMLIAVVEKHVQNGKPAETGRNEIVEVKPGVFGITVNIKEIAKRIWKRVRSRRI